MFNCPGSQARTGPRGRGRDPLGQGPGPGPLGPGAWGPLGPRCRIRVESVTTYCQTGYQLSGKLPTVRQSYLQSGKATYSQAKLPTVRQSYLQSCKATYSQAKLPTVRQSCLLSGKATYCQASKGLLSGKAKTVRHAPKSFRIHAPNIRILCTQAFPHTRTQNPHTCTHEFPHTCAQEFPHTCI